MSKKRPATRVPCEYPGCNKSFSQKSDAKRHYLNVHKGRKYSCPQCSKMFSSREMVKAHCQNVHEKKRWSCTQCEKVFRWHCNFVKHNCRGKPIVKKYKCPSCSKSYAHTSGLSRHKRMCNHDHEYLKNDHDVEEVTVTDCDPYVCNGRRKKRTRTSPPTSRKGEKRKLRGTIADSVHMSEFEEVKSKDNGLDILAIALASTTNPLIKRKLDTTNSKLDEVEKNDNEQFRSYNKHNIQTRATAFPSIPLMSSETFL